jgi:hypothetical protein
MNPFHAVRLRAGSVVGMVRRRHGPPQRRKKRENRVADIFDEVEEDLRAERTARLLKRYGWVIVALALAVIGAAIGWQMWTRWRTDQDLAAAQRYVAAQTAADAAANQPAGTATASRTAALAALDQQLVTAPDGYRTLGRLQAAALRADAGDLPGAIALWDQVAADGSADRLLRDLASLMAAQRQLDHGDPAQLQARLKPLAEPGNPWSALAREQLALLDLRQGKRTQAKTALQSLSIDLAAPTGLRQRAAALVAGLGDGPNPSDAPAAGK